MRKRVVGIFFIASILISFGVGAWYGSQPAPTTAEVTKHFPLYDDITAIKNRLAVEITEAGFTNPVPVCDFYELREEDSEDYFQTTVNYWVFQNGKGTHGDIEAYVEIYNEPNRIDLFTVEVTRSCWNELTIYLDGRVVTTFPSVTNDDVNGEGYQTFKVNVTN